MLLQHLLRLLPLQQRARVLIARVMRAAAVAALPKPMLPMMKHTLWQQPVAVSPLLLLHTPASAAAMAAMTAAAMAAAAPGCRGLAPTGTTAAAAAARNHQRQHQRHQQQPQPTLHLPSLMRTMC